jgi:peptidoglycan/xylan/chitin deacetylase (PgdA/CDA1 family)
MLKSRIVNICFLLIFFIVVINDVFTNLSVWAYLVPVLVYVAFQVYGSFNISASFFIPVRSKASIPGKAIALTFDDGPIPGRTERILDILKTHRVHAAFFCIGHRVKEHPNLVKRIHLEGHVIGNHSYWHSKTFDLQSADKIAIELKETDGLIEKNTGLRPRFFRPPYGVTNPMVAAAVRQGNHVTIGWSVRSLDTVIKDSSVLLKRVTSKLKGGDIVIFHDYSDSMLEMLPGFLTHVSQVGLKIVRVDELLNEKAYV